MSISISLTVNGEQHHMALDDPESPLLDLLRERLQLTGTKKGCDRGQCGACTVLLDGRRINACLQLAASSDGARVLTIEGVAPSPAHIGADERVIAPGESALHPMQAAFIAHDALQCGYCTPGQIMSAIGMVAEAQAGDDPERVREAMSGNICRCGAYVGIVEAVLAAQLEMASAMERAA